MSGEDFGIFVAGSLLGGLTGAALRQRHVDNAYQQGWVNRGAADQQQLRLSFYQKQQAENRNEYLEDRVQHLEAEVQELRRKDLDRIYAQLPEAAKAKLQRLIPRDGYAPGWTDPPDDDDSRNGHYPVL